MLRISLLVLSAVVLGATTACDSRENQHSQPEDVLRQAEQLGRPYFDGDTAQARDALHKFIGFMDGTTSLEPIGRSELMVLAYERLYVLEKRSTNDVSAEVALIGMQYWALKKTQLEGLDTEKALSQIRATTSEKIFEIVDHADTNYNGGREPKYVEHH